ncbi:hypothetical protein BDEG_22167 [Batrachochytrium dendrobatidis JEL423]|uniref:FAD-binding domain-containing protein n=1 Tax=Batrachochytrium dendrobatidis (strain JEL423) TaxID=403673 RepID=A0A177WEJ8_BATDL|nr:hypothetical protein BDEG_22167 [Batrachochytrium dendrobatidis JEL423]
MNDPLQHPKRILIIGGGVAGLTLALGIRQLSQLHGLNLLPVIYEATTTYTDRGQHLMIWKWAVEGLLDLGLGKRLGSIGWPVVKFTSLDASSREELVRWPSFPPATATSSTIPSLFRGSGSASVASSALLDPAGKHPAKPSAKDLDPEAGVRVTTGDASMDEHAYLPPLLGLRKPDLLRLLMTALAGHEDLVSSLDLAVKGANNNDYAYYLQAQQARIRRGSVPISPSNTAAPESEIPTGLLGDLAHANWFLDEGFDTSVPNLHMGHELESYAISSDTGKVTVRFTNGVTDSGFMLIGADGLYSKVREMLLAGRVHAQHSGTALITGICRTYMPPADVPTEFEDGTAIPTLSRDALLKFCPDGSSQSYIDRGLSFGVTNIGNGFLGWNMIVSQQHQGQVIGDYVRAKRRRDVDEWMVPSGRNSSMELPEHANQSNSSVATKSEYSTTEKVKVDDKTETVDATDATTFSTIVNAQSEEKRDVSHPVIMVHTAAALRRDQDNHASKISNSSEAPSTTQSRIVNLPDFEDTAFVSGEESRGLALHLLMKRSTLPSEASVLVARTDTGFIAAFDNMDMGEATPYSYSSPNFHPGRVLLIGDAAHGVATAAHGSVGASLAIADAVVLCKLIGHYMKQDESLISQSSAAPTPAPASSVMNPTVTSAAVSAVSSFSTTIYNGSQVVESVIGPMIYDASAEPEPVRDGSELDSDSLRLKVISSKFMALRMPVGNACCYDARAELTWKMHEEGLWKNLVKMSIGYTWARSTYQQMLTRGAPVMHAGGDDEDGIVWPKLSKL